MILLYGFFCLFLLLIVVFFVFCWCYLYFFFLIVFLCLCFGVNFLMSESIMVGFVVVFELYERGSSIF